ncbi:MAG: PHB depolymerase family esterase [Betaproteobacteria bacterium]|jgi:poly(3-hydroxybutyrate) depolymerase|nr:PHB depolymerase family esterase [Betaproteobacteria bacterium]
MKWHGVCFVGFMATCLFSFAAVHAAEPLPALAADPENLTVSGLSSGASMAVQFHVAHSSKVRGAGILAGGPYYCAGGSVLKALSSCMSPSLFAPLPKPDALRAEADKQAAAGRIDPPSGLRGSRVWLLSGGRDATVKSAVVDATRAFYLQWLPESAIAYERLPDAGHAMIAPSARAACEVTQPPYINHCGNFDAPGHLLAHLLGELRPRAQAASGELLAFDQSRFAAREASMDDTAYVYIPAACRAGGCRIHVAFHGCRQNVVTVGEDWVRQSGYNEWAETNRLLVLYPQTSNAGNPNGCWDWWGYTSSVYHTRAAPQIGAVWKMIERLVEKP